MQIRLLDFPIEYPPDYVALSYTWGDAPPRKRVTVTSTYEIGYILITASLEHALIALRDSQQLTQAIFVDQICIDQSNLEEKSQQVQHMDKTYVKALRVNVWLGPSTKYSDQYMNFVVDLCRESVFSQLLDMEVNRVVKLMYATARPSENADLDEEDKQLSGQLADLVHALGPDFPFEGRQRSDGDVMVWETLDHPRNLPWSRCRLLLWTQNCLQRML